MTAIIIFCYHKSRRYNHFTLKKYKRKMYPKVNILYPKRIQMYHFLDTFYIICFVINNGK